MLFGKEIEDLNVNDFEGSNAELLIFEEIFLKTSTAVPSKKCLFTETITFEHKYSKGSGMSLYSNFGKPSVSSQSSCQQVCLGRFYNANKYSGQTSALGILSDTLVGRNDRDASVKRIKISPSELSNSQAFMEKISYSSSLPREMTGAMPPDDASIFGSIIFNIVDTSRIDDVSSCCVLKPRADMNGEDDSGKFETLNARLQGFDRNDGKEAISIVDTSGAGAISSYCILARQADMNREDDQGKFGIFNASLQNFDRNDGKEALFSKAMASPLSQESSASKLLFASPSSSAAAEKLRSMLNFNKRPQDIIPSEVNVRGAVMKTDFKKDPRPLIQNYIVRILKGAGWCINKRKRPSRKYMETIYISPEGRVFRELPAAWKKCIELLVGDRFSVIQKDNAKEWAGIGQFWSDLSFTLFSIEGDMNQSDSADALARQYCLLDPFVTIVFGDRKVGMLRKGDVVKVAGILLAEKGNEVPPSDALGSTQRKVAKRKAPKPCYLSLVAGSASRCFGMKSYASGGQSGNQVFSMYHGQTDVVRVEQGTNEFLKGTSIINTDYQNQCSKMSGSNKISLDLLPLTSCGSDSTCIQPDSCQCNAAFTSGKCEDPLGGSETVSPHQDSNKSTADCDKHSSEHAIGTLKEVVKDRDSWEVNNHSFDSQAADTVKYDLHKSVYDNAYGRSDNLGDNLKGCIGFSLQQDEPFSPEFVTSEVLQQSGHCEEEGLHSVETLSAADLALRKRTRRKSKKISEIEHGPIYQNDYPNSSSSEKDESKEIDVHGLKFVGVRGHKLSCERRIINLKKSLPVRSYKPPIQKQESKFKKRMRSSCGLSNGKKQSQLDDDDLLVSAIIKNQDVGPSTTHGKNTCKSRARRKLKSRRGSFRLCPRSLGKGGKHFKNGRWPGAGARTVLSWLIHAGEISLNDEIQYRNLKDNTVVKDGLVTMDGIICHCCSKVLSISGFKAHAGSKLSRPCRNLYMESGKPFILCQLQAWSTEYKTKKSGSQTVQVDEDDDPNDDSCGLCGDLGELICCDNCPSAFHKSCLPTQELPEGSWYCLNCTCRICGNLVNDKEAFRSIDGRKCSQCEQKYHWACLKEEYMFQVISENWFCSGNCQKVYSGLQSRVGHRNQVADGFSWTVLRCFHDDQKFNSSQRLALRAECNSKLAVALTIMEECFRSMKDPRTGIDMIPHVLYNWGSEFARLNFHGFYTVVLEKDDVLVSVASIRIHGIQVAEMPLIATCSSCRRQGMCRRLMKAIEEILVSFEVEKLVVAAVPSLVRTWTEGFGFEILDNEDKEGLKRINMMVLPGTVMLKKPLYVNQRTERRSGSIDKLSSEVDTAEKLGISGVGIAQQPGRSCFASKADTEKEIRLVEANNTQGVKDCVEMEKLKSLRIHNCRRVHKIHLDKETVESVEKHDDCSCNDEFCAKMENLKLGSKFQD